MVGNHGFPLVLQGFVANRKILRPAVFLASRTELHWLASGDSRGFSRWWEPIVFHWFYKVLWLTVIFCSCRQGPNWCRSVSAERCFKKTKEFQRFPWDAKYGSFEVQAGISSPSRGRVAGTVVFHWFYMVSRLTVRFWGAQFFLASTKSLFLEWFCNISGCGFLAICNHNGLKRTPFSCYMKKIHVNTKKVHDNTKENTKEIGRAHV